MRYDAIQACQDFITAHPEIQMDIIFAVIDDRMQMMGEQTIQELNATESKVDQLLINGVKHDAVFFHLPEEPNGYQIGRAHV